MTSHHESMKTLIDLLLFTFFLCATSSAQRDERTSLHHGFTFEESELCFNYDLVQKARIYDSIDRWEKLLPRRKSETHPHRNEVELVSPQKKKFITTGNGQQEYPSYLGKETIRYLRAKAGGYMYIPH